LQSIAVSDVRASGYSLPIVLRTSLVTRGSVQCSPSERKNAQVRVQGCYHDA